MALIADIEGSSGGPAGIIVSEDILNSLNNLKEAQTFQVISGTWDVTSVQLYLDRNFTAGGSAETGNLTLSIRADSPTGTVLGTSAVERTDIGLSSAWKTFTFSGVTLSSGNTYTLVLECPHGFDDKPVGAGGQGDDLIQWFIDPGVGPYASGERHYHRDETGWVESSTQDNRAKIYGDSILAPNKPTTPSPANNATGVDFSGFTLGWVDGGGDTESYNVYIGVTGALTLVSSAQAGVSYVTTLSELETIFSASPIAQKIYWRVDAVNEAGTTTGDEWNFDPRPAQATVPSPAHEATEVGLYTTPLSYTVGDAVTINFKIQGGAYTEIAASEDVSSWITPYVILNIKDYNPSVTSGLRSPVAGDVLIHGDDSYTVTYVVRGVKINLQYQAKLYAFRTAGPGGKNPGDVLINSAEDVQVTLNDQWFFHGDVEQIYLPPDTTFVWRVDTANSFGATTGIEWEFSTPPFKQPKTSYILIGGGSGSGPYDYPPGEEGTDWAWTGGNNMVSIRRLVAAAKNRVFIEDI